MGRVVLLSAGLNTTVGLQLIKKQIRPETIKGKKIIDSIRSKIIITKTDLDTAIQYNPSIKFSSAKHKLSDSFWSDFYCSGHKAIKKYGHILRPPFITRLKILIYNLIYK